MSVEEDHEEEDDPVLGGRRSGMRKRAKVDYDALVRDDELDEPEDSVTEEATTTRWLP
jgi:hypothetical protein